MKELSIFVDESGDFGNYERHAPYYIIAMIFHDQGNNITPYIKKLDKELDYLGCNNYAIHTEPLIRREAPYQYYLPVKNFQDLKNTSSTQSVILKKIF